MDSISRREFLAAATAFVAAPKLAQAPPPIHIAYIQQPETGNYERAVIMSAGEAERAAQLLGREFRLTVVADTPFKGADPKWSGIIRGRHEHQHELPSTIPVIDIAAKPACGDNVFYLRPDATLAVWHSTLERFGAAQLNDRFRATGINKIDDEAWLGWFAVKCLWEAGVRNKRLHEMSFDGHKGRALVFNGARTLVQPLYKLSPDKSKVVEEWYPPAAQREATCAR